VRHCQSSVSMASSILSTEKRKEFFILHLKQ
jgi:hypothetical protein